MTYAENLEKLVKICEKAEDICGDFVNRYGNRKDQPFPQHTLKGEVK